MLLARETSMARTLKPTKLDTITVNEKAEVRVDLMLDRNKGVFFAELGGTRIEEESLEALKRTVRETGANFEGLVWKPVIYVRIEAPYEGAMAYWNRTAAPLRARTGLEFWRSEIATGLDGKLLERPFLREDGLTDADLEPRKKAAWGPGADELVVRDDDSLEACRRGNAKNRERGLDVALARGDTNCKRIPYSNAAWQALTAIRTQIFQADATLRGFLEQDDVGDALKIVALKLRLLGDGK
jgi:hypothetical protein